MRVCENINTSSTVIWITLIKAFQQYIDCGMAFYYSIILYEGNESKIY